MRKYFKFIRFQKYWKPFILLLIMNIVCQCCDGWSALPKLLNQIL